jgi:hypothetical protein
MAHHELTTTQIALFEALKASLFGSEPNYPEETDWAEVVKEAKAQTVMGVISPVIPVSDISTNQGIAKFIKILHEQDKLIKLFDENDIPCVILKGCAAAIYYPNPHLRAMGDIDILVPRDKFFEAAKVLEANGFFYEHGKDESGKLAKNERHFGYNKNGIEFELHHHFSSNGFDIDDILEDAILKREYREIDGYSFPMLPEKENGLVLIGHINQHLKGSELGLRQIVDWAVYVNKVLDDKMWDEEFALLLKKIGLDRLAIITTKMCKLFLGLSDEVRCCEGTDDELAENMLDIVLSSGNFGRKQHYTRNESRIRVALYEIKHKGVHTFLKELGLRKSKVCRSNCLLKHFAWLYGLIMFVGMGIGAVLKTKNVRKKVAATNDRLTLLEELGLKN